MTPRRLSLAKRLPIVVLFAAFAGCATSVNPVTGRTDRGLASEEQEIASGRRDHEEVLREYPPYDKPALQAYVANVGKRIAAQSHRPHLPWTFTVVDSPEINAFAVQGGFVYITRGLLAYLESEAELAGVLGHEIGHVTARHGARQERDRNVAGLGAAALTLLGAYYGGEKGAQLGQQLGAGIAQVGILLPHSREHELQADRLGAEYLQRLQWSPKAMIEVVDVLKQQETFAQDQARAAGRPASDVPNWLRTHPANDQRLDEIRRAAAQYQGQYADPGRARYLAAIDGMTFGDSRAQGVARGNTFYHEPLGITIKAPSGWSIRNGVNELAIVSGDEQAAVVMQLSTQSRGDHNAAIRAILAPDTGRTTPATINNLRATHFSGSKQNQPIEATVITAGSNDFVLRRLQNTQTRGRYDNALRDIVAGFRTMTPADAALARPYVLRTVSLPRGNAPFADLARGVPQMTHAEGQLRLLNQVYPSGTLAAGQLVKTIQ